MANNPLAGVYNGGAVNFNSQPYVNAYEQVRYRKQAQDDTLMKYFGDLGKNLTPAGMHSNDVQDLMQKKNAWQQYVMQNKENYLHPSKDNGKVYSQANSMYNDAMATTTESKNKVNRLAQIHGIFNDPAKRALMTEQTLRDIEDEERPLSDPQHKALDITHINYNPKPWSIKDQSALLNEVSKFKGTEGQPTITKDAANKQLIYNYPTKFEAKDIIGMHNLGATLYGSNPGFKEMVDKLAKAGADPTDSNHGQFVQLNNTFKQHTGQDIQSPEDVSGAYAMSLNPNKSGRIVVKNDADALNVHNSQLIEGRSNRKAAQAGGNFVNDATAAVGSGRPEEISKVFGHLFAGNGPAKHQEAKLTPDGSALELHYTTKGHDKYGPFEKPEVLKISLSDPNFKDKIAGYYQQITGSDKKAESAPYYQGQEAPKPTATPNNSDPLGIRHLLKKK